MGTYSLTSGRKAKIGMCGDCHAPIWRGVDADVCGLPVILDRAELDPRGMSEAWPNLYVIRMGNIYPVHAPRKIQWWESAHAEHNCE